jgi:hypothetical protein
MSKKYKFGFLGLSGSGKTCILAALDMQRRAQALERTIYVHGKCRSTWGVILMKRSILLRFVQVALGGWMSLRITKRWSGQITSLENAAQLGELCAQGKGQ